MSNEVNDKKVLLSDDELKQVAGGMSGVGNSDCSRIVTKDECSARVACEWKDGTCRMRIIPNAEGKTGEELDLLVPVI